MLTCSGDYPKHLLRPNHAPLHRVQCPQFQLQAPIPGLHFKSFPVRRPRIPRAIRCLRGSHLLFPGQQWV